MNLRKNDFIQQVENWKKKKNYIINVKKLLIRWSFNFRSTINILKEKASDCEKILKKFEEKNGKILNQAKSELEQLATRNRWIKSINFRRIFKINSAIKKENSRSG